MAAPWIRHREFASPKKHGRTFVCDILSPCFWLVNDSRPKISGATSRTIRGDPWNRAFTDSQAQTPWVGGFRSCAKGEQGWSALVRSTDQKWPWGHAATCRVYSCRVFFRAHMKVPSPRKEAVLPYTLLSFYTLNLIIRFQSLGGTWNFENTDRERKCLAWR